MSQMKELYEKVSKDNAMQEKFQQILKETEQAGQEATAEKLVGFARDAGFEINMQEMQEFFQEYTAKKEGELSDMELDMVAGGKSLSGGGMIALSVITLGLMCAAGSVMMEVLSKDGGCGAAFQ